MTTHLGFHGLSPSIWKNHVSICLLCLFKTDALLVIHKCLVNAMSTCRKWCVRQASAMPGNILSSNFWSCLSRSLKMFKYYPSGIRRPAGVSCGSCFFVVVLSVLSLSCLDFPLVADFWTWTHSLPPSYSFRLDLSLRCGGLNSAHASHNTGLVLHILLSFRWLFPLFCCVCHRFAPSLLISNAWSTGFCAEHLLHA